MGNAPVYEAKVTLYGSRSLVPMTVVWSKDEANYHGGERGWVVGYVMPSGHHKRYNINGNYGKGTVDEVIPLLEQTAAARKWKAWPADREQACFYAASGERVPA